MGLQKENPGGIRHEGIQKYHRNRQGTLQRLRPVRAGLCGEGAIAIIDGRRLWFRTVIAMGSARAFPDARRTRLHRAPGSRAVRRRGSHAPRRQAEGRAQATAFFSRSAKHAAARNARLRMLRDHCAEFAPRKRQESKAAGPVGERRQTWPVKLRLVPPSAPFLQGADILLAADCSAPASARFCEIASGKVVLIACPKF